MAGGYDGFLRFNTKIDEDGFLSTVKDLERSLTALEQTVGKLTKVMQAGFSQASTGAEQASADVAKLSDAADTAAENFSQLPDSETVRVREEKHREQELLLSPAENTGTVSPIYAGNRTDICTVAELEYPN